MKHNILKPTQLLLAIFFLAGVLFVHESSFAGNGDPLLLLQNPSMSKTQIVFEYGGQIWEVPRSGGKAHILASGMDVESMPFFSPDGSMVAFSGTYDKNTDIYVIPASGGQPQRLTWHPYPDIVSGWSPDGKNILFRSHRYSYSDPNQLYTVSPSGGFPQQLPLNMAEDGSYSPDGSQIAFVPNFQWEPFWKGYKGGQHTQIWIARLSDSHTTRITDLNSNEDNPMWIGNKIYFLSDRDGPITLFSYDVASKLVTRVINNTGFDITSASAGPGGIIYSQFGQIFIYDLSTGKSNPVSISVNGDLPQRRSYFQDASKETGGADISPNGVRAVFEAHGDIITVPLKEGSLINLTHSPGSMERVPAWSPDGKSIAYFSDKDGEYDLFIEPQEGGDAVKIKLGQNDAYYYNLEWSPDSKKVSFTDQKNNLWYVNINGAKPSPVKIATNSFDHSFNASWSPDGRWIAYIESLPNFMGGVSIYSLTDRKIHQVTHGMSDCNSPVFDANGKYLYFLASTNSGPGMDFDLSSYARPVTSHVYALTLEDTVASPLAPEKGLEETKPASQDSSAAKAKEKKSVEVSIDFDGIGNRIITLPIEPDNYVGLTPGPTGILYLAKVPIVVLPLLGRKSDQGFTIDRFSLKDKKTETIRQLITSFSLSANKKKILYKQGDSWFIADTSAKAQPQQLNIKDMRVYVNPHEQWDQMYHEAWRIQRAFFYNPIFDGLDIDAAEKLFAHYLPGIASRDELTFLFEEMLSYIAVGHMFIRGGYTPKMDEIHVGLLGADYKIENGRYRISRIFTAGKWNPELYAPLAQPGLKVKTGDYLLAVNGQPIDGNESIYRYFENLANQTVTLTVGPNPGMQGSHDITVKTIPSENALRNTAWIDHNMELVNKMSGGKLAYIYLPNTTWEGFASFNRYFFSQVDKQGAVVDERFNHGGSLSDYTVMHLIRQPKSFYVQRWGKQTTTTVPQMIIPGPKVLVINQFSGSGGDALPWYFRMEKAGTIVGVRTWGGLVGIGGYPSLMDGGSVTAPRMALEALDGTFPVENHGIAPDVEVWQDPELMRQGRDPQLEKSVEIAMQQLKENPPKKYEQAPWNNYHPVLPPLPKTNN